VQSVPEKGDRREEKYHGSTPEVINSQDILTTWRSTFDGDRVRRKNRYQGIPDLMLPSLTHHHLFIIIIT